MDKAERRRYILGGVTILSVLGFTAYAIYEYKKQANQREEVITVEEAKKEIEERENQEIEERFESGNANGFREEMVEVGLQEYESPTETTEEDEKLRHDPNSKEAREQFIFMNLAEWEPDSDDYNMLLYLYTFPFQPKVTEDRRLREVLIDERKNFFGEDSKWNTRITWGDVVLYYARRTVFEINGTVNHWVRFILDNMEVNHLMSSDRVDNILLDLTSHYYFNQKGLFGLFGLDDDAVDDAYTIADNRLDDNISFEIEYNEFLKRTD